MKKAIESQLTSSFGLDIWGNPIQIKGKPQHKNKTTTMKKIDLNSLRYASSAPKRTKGLAVLFPGLKLVEAKANLSLVVMPCDKGTPNDPNNCAIANCAKRSFDSDVVAIVGTVAYIDLPDGKGGKVVNRFILSPGARKAVMRNDTNQDVKTPTVITLNAPGKGTTLESRREYARKRYADPAARAKKLRYEKEYRDDSRRGKPSGAKVNLIRFAKARTAAGIRRSKQANEDWIGA